LFLYVRQHLRRINVLPPGLANIDAANSAFRGHQSDSIGQAAIAPAAAGLCFFEVIEKSARADKNSRVDCVVIFQILSDGNDLIASRLDFHCVRQIEN